MNSCISSSGLSGAVVCGELHLFQLLWGRYVLTADTYPSKFCFHFVNFYKKTLNSAKRAPLPHEIVVRVCSYLKYRVDISAMVYDLFFHGSASSLSMLRFIHRCWYLVLIDDFINPFYHRKRCIFIFFFF